MDYEHDLTRRALLRASTTAGVAAMLGVSATGEAVAVPNDDYETTTGVSEPEYGIAEPEQHYVETEYTLPDPIGGETESPTMFGEITWPADQDTGEKVKDVPIVLILSPYNDIRSPQSEAESTTGVLESTDSYYVPRGYGVAVFDVVGTRNSGGCYDYGGYRERITGKQVVEYLGGEPDAEGNYVDRAGGDAGTRKIGMIGGSYEGTTQLAAAVEDPDHLACIIPQVAIDRWYDYSYGGGVRYFLNNEYPTDEGFDTPLAFDFGFGFVPGLNVHDPERFVATNERRFAPCDAVEHTERGYEYDPVYDAYWDRRDYRQRAGDVDCAVFLESGWLDHNVKHWGSTRFFDALPDETEDGDPFPKKLVMGQWPHTSSNFEDARDVRHAWFDHWLKDLDTGVMELPRVDTQVSTGERLQHDDMPPEGTTPMRFELTRATQDEDKLALQGRTIPVYADGKPPATETEMFETPGSAHDHLLFESAPLSGPLRITGSLPLGDWRAPLLDLYASSTDDSVQFTPVLYERLPDGSVEVITRGFLNARNRDGLDNSKPVPTDEPYNAPAEFWDTDYLVREDHQLGVAIASDNRVWALDDPDGAAVTEVILGAPGSGEGTGLYLPVSEVPDSLRPPAVEGTRTDDGVVFTGGQTNHVEIDAEVVSEPGEPIRLRDAVPPNWSVYDDVAAVERVEELDDGSKYVYFAPEGEALSVEYFVEAPDEPAQTGEYTFGPVEAHGEAAGWFAVPGTDDDNGVVGQEQQP